MADIALRQNIENRIEELVPNHHSLAGTRDHSSHVFMLGPNTILTSMTCIRN